jgi:hypothetical protein
MIQGRVQGRVTPMHHLMIMVSAAAFSGGR